MAKKIKIDIRYQPLIFDALAKDMTIFCMGGYGCGKTFVAAFIVLYRLLKNKNDHIICLRKNYSDTKKSQIDAILKCADMMGVRHLLKVTKSHPISITYKNNKITTAGTSDTQNFKSITDIKCIWFEEATQIDFNDWLVISTQLRTRSDENLLKLLTFNPIDEDSWINQKYMKPNNIEPKLDEYVAWNFEGQDFGVLRTNYEVNVNNLDDNTINYYKSLKTLSPRQYQIGVEGKWGTLSEDGIFKYEKILFNSAKNLDARNIIYVDVNLNEKGKGDYTSIVKVVADKVQQRYNIVDFRCFNCTDPADLIEAVLKMKDDRTSAIGYDSHFGQGANWKHHFQQYGQNKSIMMPPLTECRYSVNAWSMNAELLFNSGRISFPSNMEDSEEGKRAINQFISFTGIKKPKAKDDFPDSVICGIALAEEKLGKFYYGKTFYKFSQ